MNDPSTYWLTLTNVALGRGHPDLLRRRGLRRPAGAGRQTQETGRLSGLDREVSDLVASFQDGHAFHIPGTGRHHGRWRRRADAERRREVTAMTCPFLREAQVKYCRTRPRSAS